MNTNKRDFKRNKYIQLEREKNYHNDYPDRSMPKKPKFNKNERQNWKKALKDYAF